MPGSAKLLERKEMCPVVLGLLAGLNLKSFVLQHSTIENKDRAKKGPNGTVSRY